MSTVHHDYTRPGVEPWWEQDTESRKWPHEFSEWPKVIDGRTLWACCVSIIGPTCQHLTPPDMGAQS